MINVLNIISDTNIGGAGTSLLNYLASYNREKFSVSIALPRGAMLKNRAEALGAAVFELDCMRDKSFELQAIKPLKRLVRELNPDIVHTHGALSARIAARHCGKPVVFTKHSAFASNPVFTRQPGKTVFKLINERYADRIIAVSEVCRADLISCGVSESRIDVVPGGAPPVKKPGAEQRIKLRRDYGFGPDDFLAGIVARIEPYKGQMFVAEAAGILRDMGKDIKIIAAGTGSYEAEVKSRVEELGLGDMVFFPGFITDTASLLGILDVQINASYVEATSISLLEGMSIGLPAVVSNESGNPWVIKDGVNGLLFKSRDPASLAETLCRLYDSRELLKPLSEGALEIYRREFTCERFAGNVEAVYLKILGDTRNGK